jgi:hypothetical protein
MATTYLAPGVYVEEVPSAQQPIAGVGTNTVGFIGIVPPTIEFPEANEHYDEHLAELMARKEPNAEAQVTAMVKSNKQSRLAQLQAARNDLFAKLAAEAAGRADKEPADGGAAGAAPPAPPKKAPKPEDDPQVKDLDKQIRDLTGELNIPVTDEQRNRLLKPYTIKTFNIEPDVPVFATKLCTNFTEYTDRFGGYPTYPDPKAEDKYKGHRALTHAVAGFFKNGGTRCFVARITDLSQLEAALRKFESIDEVALIAAPGITGRANWGKLVDHCNTTDDRFAILDSEEVVGRDDEFDVTKLNYGEVLSESMPDRSKNAAFYFPHIQVIDPAKQLMDRDPMRGVDVMDRGKLFVPPSGHVAGVYARVDEQRGVHKAPANEALFGALNTKYYISKRHQELLNPQGVNCIRNINGNITVYGGRTVGGYKNGEWKYVNVRRVMLFLKESIDEGTQWVVFEPNDPSLWAKIRLNVSAFLTRVWKSGALFGLSPEQAFYVKCDEETNPPEVRDVGQVVVEVGVAIVRPAEFVIFRVTQWTGPTKS